MDLGKAVNKEMKNEDKRVVSLDMMINAIESNKQFSFVTGTVLHPAHRLAMEQYLEIVNEIQQEAIVEKKLKSKRRSKKEKERQSQLQTQTQAPPKRSPSPKKKTGETKP